MKKGRPFYLVVFFTAIFMLVSLLTLASAFKWLSQPNNFIFIRESAGVWGTNKSSAARATGYNLKINADCAQPTYQEIEKQAKVTPLVPGHEKEYSENDYQRFLRNKASDVVFETSEISYTGRFKWFKNNYITYDDPSLKSGIRFSFANKCLYDKDCTLTDSLDYLLIKVGIRYFINAEQLEFLKTHCVENQRVYYQITNRYNFGRSQTYYRNGIAIWLGIWYNLLGVVVSVLALSAMLYFGVRRRRGR